ncbi:hypothetical protein ACF08N_36485 [Streptomyces sp. NPDC015127]|uniref:hypothetical protein n=1 Tax=Streptomyces sp. NPDC015127 TaxID=3364939 RepID=UPI003702C672
MTEAASPEVRARAAADREHDHEKRLTLVMAPHMEGSWGWVRDPLTEQERVDWLAALDSTVVRAISTPRSKGA